MNTPVPCRCGGAAKITTYEPCNDYPGNQFYRWLGVSECSQCGSSPPSPSKQERTEADAVEAAIDAWNAHNAPAKEADEDRQALLKRVEIAENKALALSAHLNRLQDLWPSLSADIISLFDQQPVRDEGTYIVDGQSATEFAQALSETPDVSLTLAKERELALAAHIKHLDGLRKSVIKAVKNDGFEDLDISFFRDDMQPHKPENSLRRFIKEKQAEAVYTATVILNDLEASEFLVELREQAKGPSLVDATLHTRR